MKAETDLCCPGCGRKIYSKGEELMHIAPFTGTEERCNYCSTLLRRRSPGGQSDTWNFETCAVVVICDYDDGTPAFIGSRQDAEKWWWKQLSEKFTEVGGYALMTEEEYKKQFPLLAEGVS